MPHTRQSEPNFTVLNSCLYRSSWFASSSAPFEAHGVAIPPPRPMPKDQAVKTLLLATKKRRLPDSDSDGGGAGDIAAGVGAQ
eukprot:2650524-Pleurochrysis_carterae.AAC.1